MITLGHPYPRRGRPPRFASPWGGDRPRMNLVPGSIRRNGPGNHPSTTIRPNRGWPLHKKKKKKKASIRPSPRRSTLARRNLRRSRRSEPPTAHHAKRSGQSQELRQPADTSRIAFRARPAYRTGARISALLVHDASCAVRLVDTEQRRRRDEVAALSWYFLLIARRSSSQAVDRVPHCDAELRDPSHGGVARALRGRRNPLPAEPRQDGQVVADRHRHCEPRIRNPRWPARLLGPPMRRAGTFARRPRRPATATGGRVYPKMGSQSSVLRRRPYRPRPRISPRRTLSSRRSRAFRPALARTDGDSPYSRRSARKERSRQNLVTRHMRIKALDSEEVEPTSRVGER